MARKRHFLEGFDPSVTDPKPGDIIYRKGVPKPTDEEMRKAARIGHLRHRRIEIASAGTIILIGFAALCGIDLSISTLFILVPLGAVLGTFLYWLDGKMKDMKRK